MAVPIIVFFYSETSSLVISLFGLHECNLKLDGNIVTFSHLFLTNVSIPWVPESGTQGNVSRARQNFA